MNFKGMRLQAHNEWPDSPQFRAESAFRELLARHGKRAPFVTVRLSSSQDADYHRCVGHLIDGLDALPMRPDYFFDHCFRLLDLAKDTLAPKKGIRGVMERLPRKLLAADGPAWTRIADELGAAIPRTTVDFLAKRLLQSFIDDYEYGVQLRARAEQDAMDNNFYVAFCKKFACDAQGVPLLDFKSNLPKAGAFLRLYLSGKPGTKSGAVSDPILDIRNTPVSAERRMQTLLSLLLFTIRNERAHGAVISPFRTSKSGIERYQSYYYLMHVCYVFALGSLMIRFPGAGTTTALIEAACQANVAAQKAFFPVAAKKVSI